MDATTKVAVWSVVGQVLVGAVSIFAIYRSPIVALNAQQSKEEAGDRRKRQFELFRTLMTFRATPLSVQFVQGLNSIDLEFDADIESETAIRNAWAALLDHFTNDKGKPDFIPTS